MFDEGTTYCQTSPPTSAHALHDPKRERIWKAHLSTFSGLLMTPSMIQHSYRGRVELVPSLTLMMSNSWSIPLWIKLTSCSTSLSVRDVAGQRDERRTEEKGKVIKRLQFQRLCFYSFSFNAEMPFWLSGKAESVQQDYGQQLMSYLVVATLPEEMVLLAVQFAHS